MAGITLGTPAATAEAGRMTQDTPEDLVIGRALTLSYSEGEERVWRENRQWKEKHGE